MTLELGLKARAGEIAIQQFTKACQMHKVAGGSGNENSDSADTSDLEDIEFLLQHLNLKAIGDVLKIIREFYPQKEVKPETIFLLEELLERAQ